MGARVVFVCTPRWWHAGCVDADHQVGTARTNKSRFSRHSTVADGTLALQQTLDYLGGVVKRVIIYLLGAAAIAAIGYALGTLANRVSPPTSTTPSTSVAVASNLSSEPVPVAGGYTIVSTEQVRAGSIADIKSVIVRAALTEVISQSQAESTLHAILDRVTTSAPDIDEIIVLLYSDPAITDGAYDIGTAMRQPAGGRINLRCQMTVDDIDNLEQRLAIYETDFDQLHVENEVIWQVHAGGGYKFIHRGGHNA